jgi:serine/threonine protein phosphatase PrpC
VPGTDGLANPISADDLVAGAARHHGPQEWSGELVGLALQRGSIGNVTCVVAASS